MASFGWYSIIEGIYILMIFPLTSLSSSLAIWVSFRHRSEPILNIDGFTFKYFPFPQPVHREWESSWKYLLVYFGMWKGFTYQRHRRWILVRVHWEIVWLWATVSCFDVLDIEGRTYGHKHRERMFFRELLTSLFCPLRQWT